ncbi:SGNH/GDSL hydrolase family protein [soil metagenome]
MALVLLPFAASVTAQEKSPFEDEIVAFEKADKTTPPVKGGIVFVGSSSIRRWESLKRDFLGRNVINRGFGGSAVSDSVRNADRIVTPYAPKMIVFFAGTNDIAGGKSAEAVAADYRAFVEKVRAKLPKVPVVFLSITPAPSRQDKWPEFRKANAMIQAYSATDPNLFYVDVYDQMLTDKGGPRPELFVEDQLHMNIHGYAIWRKALIKRLPQM